MPIRVIFWVSLILAGGYFEGCSAIVSCSLLIWLIIRSKKHAFRFYRNDAAIAVFGISVFYFLSIIWAVDRGTAVWGAVKYLPLPLILLCYMQLEKDERDRILFDLPWTGALMTILSFLLRFIPALNSSLMINGRLGGFFQYPNTFAAFLLTGLIVCIFHPKEAVLLPVGHNKNAAALPAGQNEEAVLLPIGHNKGTKQVTDGLYGRFRGEMLRLFLLLFFLCAGLILSGSRAVMAITLVVLVLSFCLILKKSRAAKSAALTNSKKSRAAKTNVMDRPENDLDFGKAVWMILFIVIGAGVGFLAANFTDTSAAGHIVQGSASTFWGRLIYMQDALGQLMKHPLGTGYLGYYFTQGSFQTAAYSVRWVHNDLLQLGLDTGWIPLILLVIAFIKGFRSRTNSVCKKILLAVLILHGLMDFDLEFLSMWFILLGCLDIDEVLWNKKVNSAKAARSGKGALSVKKKTAPNIRRGIGVAAAVILSLGSLYIGLSAWITSFGDPQTAHAFYPPNTLAETALLTKAQTAEEMDAYADRILSRNRYISLAWDARAEAAYSRGEFQTVIEAKRQAIFTNRYDNAEYADYQAKLETGIQYYVSQNDNNSAAVLKNELQWIDDYYHEMQRNRNPLAEKLDSP